MINLLPPQTKQDILFARRNTVLRNWAIAVVIAVSGVALIIAGGHMFINQSISTSQSQLADINASLKEQKLEETQKRVTDISDSIKLALQVLSREILFSKLISQVGAAMPSGASLQSLSIGSTEGGIDLTAGADDYQTATQVQVNLADKDNKIFEKADIVNITCVQPANTGATATGPEPYPCTISIRALFSKDNGFQYITAAGLKK